MSAPGVDIDAAHIRRPTKPVEPGSLADRLQRARLAMNMSRDDLADEACVTYSVIADIERGKYGLALEKAVRIARALDVSLDYLAGLTPEFGKFPLEAE